MIRTLIALSALALLLGATSTAHARNAVAAVACPGHVQGVYYYRNQTRKWERKLGRQPSKSQFNASKVRSCRYVVWVAAKWRRTAHARHHEYVMYVKKLVAERSTLTSDWACIHRYEGAWDSNTGNGYYGGLQMDSGFQSEYGSEFVARWGTADNWPVWAQVTAAERAKNGYGRYGPRGYAPWPNTARACGLL